VVQRIRHFQWLFAHWFTWRFRATPSFLIIGAQKGGTTALAYYLRRYPSIAMPPVEVHYFDQHYTKGLAWYRAFFSLRWRIRSMAVGEKSPNYLSSPHAPARAYDLNPRLKLLIALRDPVDRALSHYYHERAGGRETETTFEDALQREAEHLEEEERRMITDPHYFSLEWRNRSYISRGEYWRHIERWMDYFGREQVLIIDSKDLYTDPAGEIDVVCEFLGVKPISFTDWHVHVGESYSEMAKNTRERLARYFEPHNQRLFDLTGQTFDWTKPSVNIQSSTVAGNQ